MFIDQPDPFAGPLRIRFLEESGRVDEADRQRVAGPFVLFESEFDHTLEPIKWEQKPEGGGQVNHLAGQAAAELQSGTSSGDRLIFQTRQHFFDIPGLGRRVMIACAFDGFDTDVRKRIGWFDEDDGVWLETNGSSLRIVTRSNSSGAPVDTVVAQQDWEIDTFDGSGGKDNPSGYNFDDMEDMKYLVIDSLNPGRIRIGFRNGGKTHYAHQFVPLNDEPDPLLGSGNLPIRMEIEALDDLGAAATLRVFSAAVLVDGKAVPETAPHSTPGHGPPGRAIVQGTFRPIAAIRAGSFHQGLRNRAYARPISANILSTKNTRAQLRWARPGIGSLPNANWQKVGSNSMVEYDQSGTHTTFSRSQTELLDADYISAGQKNKVAAASSPRLAPSAPPISSNISGSASSMVILYAQSLDGNATAYASLSYQERI